MGKRILFIRGPNFEMLPAAHRTLGSTQPWRAKLSKMNPLRCGTPARDGANKIRPSGSHRFALRASVFVLVTWRSDDLEPAQDEKRFLTSIRLLDPAK